MGCCGCTNKSSVIVAGILGLIQAAVGLAFNIYFLHFYYFFTRKNTVLNQIGSDKIILLAATEESIPVIRGLLITATLLHSAWLISSIVLLVGNRTDHVPCLRQWIVITSLILIGDLIFAPILIGFTITSVLKTHENLDHALHFSGKHKGALKDASDNLWKYYLILVGSFCRLGLITFITNICLAIFTGRRVSEIIHPTTGYVLAPAPPGAVPVYPVLQPGYPMSHQGQPLQIQSPEPKSYNSKF